MRCSAAVADYARARHDVIAAQTRWRARVAMRVVAAVRSHARATRIQARAAC